MPALLITNRGIAHAAGDEHGLTDLGGPHKLNVQCFTTHCGAVQPLRIENGQRLDRVQRVLGQKDPRTYLLRSQSRGRGIGFFEAGNFYPDFILWLLVGNYQYVTFVDPKGLRNLRGNDDPKIGFYQQIKELETRLGDPNLALNSCIVAPTRHADVAHWRDETGQLMSRVAFEQRHVFFQKEDEDYIEKLLNKVVHNAAIPR